MEDCFPRRVGVAMTLDVQVWLAWRIASLRSQSVPNLTLRPRFIGGRNPLSTLSTEQVVIATPIYRGKRSSQCKSLLTTVIGRRIRCLIRGGRNYWNTSIPRSKKAVGIDIISCDEVPLPTTDVLLNVIEQLASPLLLQEKGRDEGMKHKSLRCDILLPMKHSTRVAWHHLLDKNPLPNTDRILNYQNNLYFYINPAP
jgi:hypothetical protein